MPSSPPQPPFAQDDRKRPRGNGAIRLGFFAGVWGAVAAGGMPSAGRVRAEHLTFARGGRITAPAVVGEGRVDVETPFGRFAFRPDDFATIREGGCPDREWESRRRASLERGPDACYQAAWWALVNGLTVEASSLLRQTHERHPEHAPTARLAERIDALDTELPEPDLTSICEAVGVTCDVARGPHILLLHQLPPAEAAERVRLLERVLTTYDLWLSASGFDLKRPSRKLVCVHLRDRADYLAFLKREGAGAFLTTQGYYHPTRHVVVTFDARTAPKWVETFRRLAPAQPGSGVVSGEPARLRLLAEAGWRSEDFGAAAHELVHLLVHVSELSADVGGFPLWLHEGLAAQFEVVRCGRWAGVGQVHDLRLADWRSISTPPDLRNLVRDGGFGHGYRQHSYAQAWSLVYYLRRARPEQFRTYVDLLRTPDPTDDRAGADRYERLFFEAFEGDSARLNDDWTATLARLRLPTELPSGREFHERRRNAPDRD